MTRRVHRLAVLVLATLPACHDVMGLPGDALAGHPRAPSADTDAPGDDPDAGPQGDAGSSSGDAGSSSSGGDDDGALPDPGSSSSGEPDAGSSSGGEAPAGDDGPAPDCLAPAALQPCDGDTLDPLRAIGLGCPGDDDTRIPVWGAELHAPDAASWAIASQLGTALDELGQPRFRPREGERFLAITTGHVAAPDPAGAIAMTPAAMYTDNDNPDAAVLPSPVTTAPGSNDGAGGTPFVGCDGSGDCSDTLALPWAQGGAAAHDLAWLRFDTLVPEGTFGFGLDLAFFSVEFPEFVGSAYNDVLLLWSSSEAYTGNLCFVDGQPCTVTSLCAGDDGCAALRHCAGAGCDAPDADALAGTGFELDGGGTGWFRANGPAVPGESLELTVAVFDMGDASYDTLVLLDDFDWSCDGCIAGVDGDCGLGFD
ncbi:MAG: choice-of-anchor L domain-containing protein [Nannocystaceae bacterium]|nr:choice-of-anchor L domain-containing protein [Nannocystaceae bacterium]